MRTTLSLDEDVAILLEKVRKEKDITFKQVVNDTLRQGLISLTTPSDAPVYRTQPVDLGGCRFPSLDNVWEILDEVEGSETGR